MSRTVLDITVNGKLVPEVRSEVLAWMRERKYRTLSELESLLDRLGSLGPSPPT